MVQRKSIPERIPMKSVVLFWLIAVIYLSSQLTGVEKETFITGPTHLKTGDPVVITLPKPGQFYCRLIYFCNSHLSYTTSLGKGQKRSLQAFVFYY